MSLLISDAHAQAAGGAAQSPLPSLLIMVVFVVIFYFLLIRPQQKRAKEHQAMLSKLVAGDEVVTAGGIVGRIAELGDNFVSLEVADGVCIKVQRGQLTALLPKGTFKG
ncbi:MAG: preprotein translocase subunit YajC [Pseudomonadota bacterium]|jgi:preprotein translocase subunit YajC